MLRAAGFISFADIILNDREDCASGLSVVNQKLEPFRIIQIHCVCLALSVFMASR